MLNKNIVFSIFIFFLTVYIFTSNAHIGSFDGKMMFSLTRNIVEKKQLTISKYFEETGLWKGIKPRYGLGQSLLAIPLYQIGKIGAYILPHSFGKELVTEFSCSLFNSLITAMTMVVFLLFCRRIGYSLKISIIVTLIYGFGTMSWIYSKGFISDPLLTLLLLLSTYLLYSFKKDKKSYLILLSGFSLGMCIFTKIASVIFIIPLFYYLSMITWEKEKGIRNFMNNARKSINFFAPVLLFIVLVGMYNYYRFGSIFLTGYQGESFSMPLGIGLFGRLFGLGSGLFPYNPVLFLSLPAIFVFYKKKRSEAILFAILIIFQILLIAKWSWGGAGWWGPRLLLPILPYYLLPIGSLLSDCRFFKRIFGIWLFRIIFCVSIGIQVLSISVNPGSYLEKMEREDGISIEKVYFSLKYSPLPNQFVSLCKVIGIMRQGEVKKFPQYRDGGWLKDSSYHNFSYSILDILPVWLFYFGISRVVLYFYLILSVVLLSVSGLFIYYKIKLSEIQLKIEK